MDDLRKRIRDIESENRNLKAKPTGTTLTQPVTNKTTTGNENREPASRNT